MAGLGFDARQVRGKSTSAREMVIHGGRVKSTYTHVTDQHATYGTKIIVATKREAHYVLDEILGSATDLPITEHATDTHGVTLMNFHGEYCRLLRGRLRRVDAVGIPWPIGSKCYALSPPLRLPSRPLETP